MLTALRPFTFGVCSKNMRKVHVFSHGIHAYIDKATNGFLAGDPKKEVEQTGH
jgi:hypothetical protein